MIYQIEDRKVEFKSANHFVAENATVVGSVVIGNNVSIWFNAIIRADNDSIVIGNNSNIQDAAVLHTDPGFKLILGEGVTVGHQVMLHGCTIGSNSLIGIGAVILNGAKIGKNCLIGANSLIPEGMEIPDGSLVFGSPGKIIRSLNDKQVEGLSKTATNYVNNFKRYQASLIKSDSTFKS